MDVGAIFDTMKNWTTKPAEHYTYRHFPEPQAEVDPLKVYDSYYRVTLSQLFLGTARKWFTELYPAAHSSVRYQYADFPAVELSHVTHAPEQKVSKGIELNTVVTGLLPFNGGTLELNCVLIALHGKDYLDASLKMLGSFSSLVAGPVSQALTVATEVSKNLHNLVVGNDGEEHLKFQQTFSEANLLRPGHYAAILATEAQLAGKDLMVEEDQLRCDGEPFTGFDYLLFRIDAVPERADWRMQEIQKNLNAARKAYILGRKDEGDQHKAAAVIAAYDSQDLSEVDRARVVKRITDALAPFEAGASGAVREDMQATSLDGLMSDEEVTLSREEAIEKLSGFVPTDDCPRPTLRDLLE
jgi:hypothetical protein